MGVLSLCRDAVGVFLSPNQLGNTRYGTLIPLQRCSRSILKSQPTGSHSLWDSYPSVEMQSVYSSVPTNWVTLAIGDLSLCRDAVGVFLSPNQLGHTRYGSLIPLQRCSRCILKSQPTGSHSLWESYPSAEMQSVYS